MAKKAKKKKAAKKKPNAGRALTAEKREQMFQVFFKTGTVNSVRVKCKVHIQTALKYKKVDNWEHRAEEIKRKAAKKIDNYEANRISKHTSLVEKAIDVWVKALVCEADCPHCGESIPYPGIIPKFIDIDKLIRLQEFLSGSPDSRPDVPRETITDIEELKQLLQQKKEQLKNLGSNSK